MSCLWNSYCKALQNPTWSFMRWLSDFGDTLLGIFMFWVLSIPPREEFTVKGKFCPSLLRRFCQSLFYQNSTDERWTTLPVICRSQWAEDQLIIYWKRDNFVQTWLWRYVLPWFLITMALFRIIRCLITENFICCWHPWLIL